MGVGLTPALPVTTDVVGSGTGVVLVPAPPTAPEGDGKGTCPDPERGVGVGLGGGVVGAVVGSVLGMRFEPPPELPQALIAAIVHNNVPSSISKCRGLNELTKTCVLRERDTSMVRLIPLKRTTGNESVVKLGNGLVVGD
jgi:hypothetical protein